MKDRQTDRMKERKKILLQASITLISKPGKDITTKATGNNS